MRQFLAHPAGPFSHVQHPLGQDWKLSRRAPEAPHTQKFRLLHPLPAERFELLDVQQGLVLGVVTEAGLEGLLDGRLLPDVQFLLDALGGHGG